LTSGALIKTILLLTMLYFHIMDDYRHQGILASMKQKSWWQQNAPDGMYRNDYIVALFEHAFSWTFAIHIPAIFYKAVVGWDMGIGLFLFVFIFMWTMHAFVDHMKANLHMLNLAQDQLVHLAQVVFVWGYYCFTR